VFVGDASHELRSPLALIRALAELLERGDLAPDQRSTAAELVAVTDEANALVEDLLLLARLSETDEPEPDAGRVDLADVASTTAERLRPLLEEHGSHLELALQAAPAAIPAFEAARIVRALIENVVAHTPVGTSVRLTTRQVGRRSTLCIEDSGPGVPDHDLERVFERFTQLDPARTPGASAGAGLGLAIVRAIASRRQGETVASRSRLGGLKVEVSLRAP
jgi:signal transduction histidine kinase